MTQALVKIGFIIMTSAIVPGSFWVFSGDKVFGMTALTLTIVGFSLAVFSI